MVTKPLPNPSTTSGVSKFFLNNRNIAICILLNTVVIFLLSFHRFQHVLLPLDVAFTIFFIIEMIVKIKCLGKSFFKDKECVFDLLIVVVSSIPLFGLFSLDWIQVMRLTRIFKSLRLFELIPNYKKLLINFRLVIRSCIGILVGLSILIFLLSIILSSLYGSIVPEYFGNPLESIYSVLAISCQTEGVMMPGASNISNFSRKLPDYYTTRGDLKIYEFADVDIQRHQGGVNIRNGTTGVLIFSSLLNSIPTIFISTS